MSAAGGFPAPGLPPGAHVHPSWTDFGPTAWVSLVLAAAFAGWVIWKAVMYTLRPGETEPEHIKRLILREPGGPPPPVSSVRGSTPAPAPGAPDETRGS